jgi:hypothetical protein
VEYRVGVRMSANIPYGSSDHFWRIGAAKAIVFPEPVLAPPIQSRPTVNAISKNDTFENGSDTGRLNRSWSFDRHC